jgi:hypothetical protein
VPRQCCPHSSPIPSRRSCCHQLTVPLAAYPTCVELSSGRPTCNIYHWLILAIHALPKDEAQVTKTTMEPANLSATSSKFNQCKATQHRAWLFCSGISLRLQSLLSRFRGVSGGLVRTPCRPTWFHCAADSTLDGSRTSSHLPAPYYVWQRVSVYPTFETPKVRIGHPYGAVVPMQASETDAICVNHCSPYLIYHNETAVVESTCP